MSATRLELSASASRQLLENCSGSDALLGSAPVWASIIILLAIGFVVGAAIAIAVMHYRQQHWLHEPSENYGATSDHATHEGHSQDGTAVQSGWVPAVLRHKRTVSAQLAEGARSAGPLSVGLQSNAGSLQTVTTLDNPAFRSSADTAASLVGAQGPSGYIPSMEDVRIPIHDILDHQPSLVKEGSTIKAYAAETEKDEPAKQDGRSIAHQTVAAVAQGEGDIAKQTKKAKDAEAVGQAYELDDLDDEWKELLCELDARLLTMDKQTLDSQERAVAIRSLLVSTARETPEEALSKAIADIVRYRRVRTK